MSIHSPSDVLDMVNFQQDLSHRVTATRHAAQSQKCLSTLLALSEELRCYSAKNRAYAEQIRRNAKAFRQKLK